MTIRQIDVSHYRAPFKDALFLSGFGAAPALSLRKSGRVPVVPLSTKTTKEGKTMTTTAAATTAPTTVTITNEAGYREFDPRSLEAMFQALQAFSIVVEGNDETVSIHPIQANDPREWAPSWISRKLGEGKAIAAGGALNIDQWPVTMFTSTETTPHALFAIANTDDAKKAAAPAGGTMSAVLFTPQAAASLPAPVRPAQASSWSTTKILVVGAAVAGGIGLLAMAAKKKRG